MPEGIPGGDDEYGSIVFDESFVRAARIQEYSATERMRSDARAVRTRRVAVAAPVSRQAMALVLLIVIAFGTAIYMGVRHPYKEPTQPTRTPLAVTLVPLAPATAGRPAAATVEQLLRRSPAAGYPVGAQGVVLPPAKRTEHFTLSQVLQATATAKDYVVASSLDPDVLTRGRTGTVRRLLDPGQRAQFDRGLARPADDGRHAATGWMVRFDPAEVALADPHVRVRGTIEVNETGANALEVVADHTFVYAVRERGGAAEAGPMLFTVRRELHMRFDREDLRESRITLVESAAEAGPQACTADSAAFFRPLFGGGGGGADPRESGGTNPHDHRRPVAAACGVLDPGA
ncbi:hypothetical protein GCM10027168_68780 [Streptomyces capparidis]